MRRLGEVGRWWGKVNRAAADHLAAIAPRNAAFNEHLKLAHLWNNLLREVREVLAHLRNRRQHGDLFQAGCFQSL